MSSSEKPAMVPRRVLLTGATGFVGSHVAEAFAAAGWRIRALARAPARAQRLAELGAEVVTGTLDDATTLAEASNGVAAVVHMAALTHARSEAAYHRVNVTGTRAVLEAALTAAAPPRRFVYLSSLAAAGPSIDGRGVRHDDEPRPLTAYGRSKLEGERVCIEAAGHLEVAILRAPAVYGPRDTDLYQFFRIARLGVVPLPSGAARLIQMIHVKDLARAIVQAVIAPHASGIYHIADAQAYSWEQVGQLVGEAVGKNVNPVRVPAPLISALAGLTEMAAGVLGRSVIFNRDKAREMLASGWLCETEAARLDLDFESAIPLAVGLRDTAQWYREQGWL